ncbi:FAD-binding oxidoreductase [Sporosarcina sp.]|uniref:FAD-binding oxidoreductase n=1 Tax=Sporosarcina sp. TaxID=49982 RepID=UPI0026368570|nr:FAD-binding oxidoreductase [Sporosarcina sp.]
MKIQTESIVKELASLIEKGTVSQDIQVLKDHDTDMWPLRMVEKAVGKELQGPLCVVKPATTEEVSKVLAYLNEHKISVVPYGGGSGVTGGSEPDCESVIIDVGHMNSILDLNEDNLTVTAQPGVVLRDLETYLESNGYTGGHFPQSIDLAQLGGLVATRSSGQYSTKYGNIEDLLLGLEAVLPDGEVIRIKDVPRRSVGPDLRHIFLGSEGTMGIITEVTLKVFEKSTDRWLGAYAIKDMEQGLKIIQRFIRTGWNPAVTRLHDAVEAERSYSNFIEEGESILLLLSEGPEGYAQTEGTAIDKIVQAGGGRALGDKPLIQWLEKRNNTKELEEYTSQGIIVDTIEISANWSDVAVIYEEVLANLKRDVPEVMVASGHSSHSYDQGTNIYFMLGAMPKRNVEDVSRVYKAMWQSVIETTLSHNGSICHHHGIGKVRAQWVPSELGSSYQILEKVKMSLDPNGIMNKGTLMPQNEK